MMPQKKTNVWPQWLAASTIHILAILVGLAIGSTSPFLARLKRGTEAITITDDQASWIASLVSITRPIGAIIAAVVAQRLGSKKAVLIGGIPHALAWTCLLMEESVPWIYASRIMSGFGLGMYYSTFPLYIGEISDPNIRGALISLIVQGLAVGSLLGNLLGAYVYISDFAVISLVLTAMFFFPFLFFPDSPHFLVKNGRIEDAERSLQWFSRQKDVTVELEALKSFTGTDRNFSLMESFRQSFMPTNRKIVLTVLCIYIFMQMSGLFTIGLYMELLLTNLKVDVVAPSLVVVGAGLVAVVSSFISMYTNDHFGRRIMLATSCIGVAVNLFLLGLNCLILKQGYNSENLQWLSIIGMMMYQFFIYMGMLPISNCLMSELFPPHLRVIGPCMANITSGLFAFLTSKSYQPMVDATSEEFMFWFYASFAFGMLIFTITVIPETKGKSLQEIQEMLGGDSKNMLGKEELSLPKVKNIGM